MKRSEQIVLGAAGLILVAALWPASEEKGPEGVDPTAPLIYASAGECRAGGAIPIAECDAQWKKAEDQQVAAAPKFEQLSYCETTFGAGACKPASANGTSFFVPAMVGFMLARQLGGSGVASVQPLYPGRAGFAPGQPGAGFAQQRPCPPGASPQSPECQPARSTSGGSSSGSSYVGSSRGYSTGSGAAVATTPRGTSVARTSTGTSSSGSVSRSGFGSTSRSFSSGG